MLLKEMFSAIGAPKETEQEIDWLDDLKFYIDNNNHLTSKTMFPAVERHKKYKDHPEVFKVYIRPLETCVESYCNMFDIDNGKEIFTKEKIIELAKHMAEQQNNFIKKGDYDE
jgi:hypothetical protein